LIGRSTDVVVGRLGAEHERFPFVPLAVLPRRGGFVLRPAFAAPSRFVAKSPLKTTKRSRHSVDATSRELSIATFRAASIGLDEGIHRAPSRA
jgi:hypothetical protein